MTTENTPAKEPTLCNEVVYEDSELKLTKLWTWNVRSLHEEKDAGVLMVLLSGKYHNCGGKSTFVSYDGKRLTDLEFDYVSEYMYSDEMWKVGINEQGYGFLNKDYEIAIPLKYKKTKYFKNGYAGVHDGNNWLYVDKKGNEIHLENIYKEVKPFYDGLARVSTIDILYQDKLSYHSDYNDIAGNWGYIDKSGREVIKPQYIYAFNFINDRAVVAKGKWEKHKKSDNESNQEHYWTEEELWGVIDKNGNEIIPCKYDEIRWFIDDYNNIIEDYYQVHTGGWENGKWAILDRNGNFITEPIFEDYSYDYFDGLMTYREKATWDDVPIGIYDLKENKILFEPQFDDVTFLDDGNILVEFFDKDLGHKVEKIIDHKGKDVFKSDYTSIYPWWNPVVAVKEGENSTIYNIIDEKGNILESKEFDEKVSVFNSAVNFETKTYIYSDNDKRGLKNFDGKILIPAKYEYFEQSRCNDNFYYFEVKKDSNQQGLMMSNGTVIIKPDYDNINILENKKIICNSNHGVDVYEYELK